MVTCLQILARYHIPISPASSTGRCNTNCYKSLSLKVVFMTQARRVRLSALQRTDMWRRGKAGEALHEIGRAFNKSHVSIHCRLSSHGGVVPPGLRLSLSPLVLSE